MMVAHVLAYAFFILSINLYILSLTDASYTTSTLTSILLILSSIMNAISEGFFICIFN